MVSLWDCCNFPHFHWIELNKYIISCGKVIRDENGMMFHASKTGHENFEESSDNIKPLTEEEKKVQAALLKERIKVSIYKSCNLKKKYYRNQ